MSETKTFTRDIGKQLYIEQYGLAEYERRINTILPPEEDPRQWSGGRRMKEALRFRYQFFRFSMLFGLGALFLGRRITHTVGIGSKGKLILDAHPAIEGLPIFKNAGTFDIRVRQADATYLDNAACVVRSCSVKIFDASGKNILDLLMNSGAKSIIWNIPSFLNLMGIRSKGETPENLHAFFREDPLSTELLDRNMYRVDSLTDLSYYSKIRYLIKNKEGKTFATQFRCIPNKPEPEGSISVQVLDEKGNWQRGRFEGDDRPWDYLHQEYDQRIQQSPIEYVFQVQQKEVLPEHHSFSRDMYYFNATWDEPWLDIGMIHLEALLDREETRKLSFNIANRPAYLTLPESHSIDDYCAIAAFRTRIYPRIQPLRHLSHAIKSWFGKAAHYNYKTETPPSSDGSV